MQSPSSCQPTRTPAGEDKSAGLVGLDDSRCMVVMYHYVRPGSAESGDGVRGLSPDEFASQIDLLCETMEPISWPVLYGWTRGLTPLPSRCFLLSFDDGLADHWNHVFPVLEKCGLSGVFFLPGIVLAGRGMLAPHAIHLLLNCLGEDELTQNLMAELAREVGDHDALPTGDDEAKALRMYHYEPPTLAKLKYMLTVMLPVDLRNRVVQSLFERHVGSVADWSRRWYLSWDHLVEMTAHGHTIGGHGFSHEPFGRLTPRERRVECVRTAEILRDGLGMDPRPFSYPFGSFDDDSAQACKEAGFVHAFTTQRGGVTRRMDAMTLPRVDTIHVELTLKEESHVIQPGY